MESVRTRCLLLLASITLAAQAADKPATAPPAISASAKQVVAKHAMAVIREGAREPDSVKFKTLLINDSGTVVCAEFRGKNGFGGVSFERLVLTDKGSDSTVTGWNKACTKGMFNMGFLLE